MTYRIRGTTKYNFIFHAIEVDSRRPVVFETTDINAAFKELARRIEVAEKHDETIYEVVEYNEI